MPSRAAAALLRTHWTLHLLVPLLAAAALTCGGCGRHTSAATPHAVQAAPTVGKDAGDATSGEGVPRRGGTIVTGSSTMPAGANELISPQTEPEAELTIQLFARLLREAPDFADHPPTFGPDLARSYEWSPDMSGDLHGPGIPVDALDQEAAAARTQVHGGRSEDRLVERRRVRRTEVEGQQGLAADLRELGRDRGRHLRDEDRAGAGEQVAALQRTVATHSC